MVSDPFSLTLGITFDSMKLRKSVSDPYLDALVEYYKDGNYYKLNEGHANHIGSVGTENFDPPDDDCLDGDTGSNNSSITTQLLTKSSTCMHEKEPFDACRCKVNQLCIDISLGAPSTIDRTNGGSYNRVIGLSFQSNSGIQRRVLRILRE